MIGIGLLFIGAFLSLIAFLESVEAFGIWCGITVGLFLFALTFFVSIRLMDWEYEDD